MMQANRDTADLYERYLPRIRGYLARLVPPADAEDLAQEVFTRAHRAIHAHRGDARLLTWLYRIATHAAIDHLRRPSSRAATVQIVNSGRPESGGSADELEACDADPEAGFIKREMRSCIMELVAALPESYRAVILLGELRGLKDAEVAAELNITIENAKVRLHRGRSALRKLMERHCDLYRDERSELACDRKPTDSYVKLSAPRSSSVSIRRRSSST